VRDGDLIDGLVLARSAFHHSMTTVVVLGCATVLMSEKRNSPRCSLCRNTYSGRWADVRAPNEPRAHLTQAFFGRLQRAPQKVRTGPR